MYPSGGLVAAMLPCGVNKRFWVFAHLDQVAHQRHGIIRAVLELQKMFIHAARRSLGKAIIPIDQVCRDYFSHLTPPKLVQKISAGEIAIPLVRIETSQKCAKGVHLTDLASYLDARVEAARREMTALTS
jgi:Pyocin activator protein PrtN